MKKAEQLFVGHAAGCQRIQGKRMVIRIPCWTREHSKKQDRKRRLTQIHSTYKMRSMSALLHMTHRQGARIPLNRKA